MRRVTYSMSMSLDGYIVGPDGQFDWSEPDEKLHRFWNDDIRGVGVHLLGRNLYETMLYWEDPEQDPDPDPVTQEFAELWNPLPKVVFSRTLTEVRQNARLATGTLAEEIARLRADDTADEIAIGGANLAAQAAELDLIDEYRIVVCPVLVGGGIPFFAHRKTRSDLEFLETRTFGANTVYLHYRVRH